MAFDAPMKRRLFLATSLVVAVSPARAQSQRFQPVQDIQPLLRELTHGATPSKGGMQIELPQIAENGNSVPMRIRVTSPMTAADHVEALYLIAERNPRPLVATFHLGPTAGRADVATRVRLAGTQTVRVLAALSGGRFQLQEQEVLVTSAACLDESM
jgi:sulfur-oxidizing protein SoxY